MFKLENCFIKLCTIIIIYLCVTTKAYNENADYMKREHSLVKPYQGKCIYFDNFCLMICIFIMRKIVVYLFYFT